MTDLVRRNQRQNVHGGRIGVVDELPDMVVADIRRHTPRPSADGRAIPSVEGLRPK